MNMTTLVSPDRVSQIGNTPLVELSSFSTNSVKFFIKLESFNPFGSVKDRAG
jgi:S-sulfo-L-cysteine synthase (O-acetyl-L-serine-dependent)